MAPLAVGPGPGQASLPLSSTEQICSSNHCSLAHSQQRQLPPWVFSGQDAVWRAAAISPCGKEETATARKAVATERAAAGCLGPRERLADSGHRTSPGPCHSTGAKPPAAFACGPCRSGLASLLMPPPHQLRPLCHHTAVSRFLNRVSLCT